MYQLLINGIVLLMICTLGFLANSITLYILNSGQEMRSQTINIYLSFLAIYDNGVLFSAILMFSLPAMSHLCFLLSSRSSLEENVHPFNTKTELEIVENMLNSGPHPTSISSLLEQLHERYKSQLQKQNETEFMRGISRRNESIFKQNNSSSGDLVKNVRKKSRQYNGTEEKRVETQGKERLNEMKDTLLGNRIKDGLHGNETFRVRDRREEEEAFENPSHYYIALVYPLALVVQTGSIWTTCLVTIERYWAVAYPLRAMVLSTRKRGLIALTIVSIASFVYNLPRFFEVQIKTDEETGVRTIEQSSLRLNETYRLVYYIILNLLVIHVIPLITLTVLNFKIHQQIRSANVNRAHLSASQRSELNVSSMLMVLVLIFIICNFPAFIVNVLEVFGVHTNFIDSCATVSNLLVCINSSVNFLIYCIHGQRFRDKFIRIITCRSTRSRTEHGVSGNQPSHVFPTNHISHQSGSPVGEISLYSLNGRGGETDRDSLRKQAGTLV